MTLGIFFGILTGLVIAFILAPLFAKAPKGVRKKSAPGRKNVGVLAAFVLLVSFGIYYMVGRPDLVRPPTFPENFGGDLFAQQSGDQLPSIDIMVEQLKARLQVDPNDVEGWSLLGQSLMILNRFDEAADAFQQAIVNAPDNADLHSALGEALTLVDDGFISEAAALSFQNALSRDPGEPISLFYMGDYAFQKGNIELAYERWLAVYEDIPSDIPWLPLLEQRLQEAAGRLGFEPPPVKTASIPTGPLAEDIQQMSKDDQQAMIEGMVASLAVRLEENPDDMEGWARLGRSYMVLGRFEEGADAYARIATAMPDDIAAQQQYAQALLTQIESKGNPVSDEAVKLLTHLKALDATNPTALFYLGQAAAERGDKTIARDYWEKLLSLYGPNSEDAGMIREKLDSLK